MAIEHTPPFVPFEHPAVAELFLQHGVVRELSAAWEKFTQAACLLALDPTGTGERQLYNVRYLTSILDVFDGEEPSVNEVYAVSEKPEMREIVVDELQTYCNGMRVLATADLHRRPCLHSSNLERAYLSPRLIGQEVRSYRTGGYYPLYLFDTELQPTGGILGQQVLSIPGGHKTAALANEAITGRIANNLFRVIQKNFNESECQPPQSPIDFVTFDDEAIRVLSSKHQYDYMAIRTLAYNEAFLSLAPSDSTRAARQPLLSARYIDQVLSRLPPGSATITSLQDLAFRSDIQKVMASEIGRYLSAIANNAVQDSENDWHIPYAALALTGRTVHSTQSMRGWKGYRPLIDGIGGEQSGPGIVAQQTMTFPGSENVGELVRAKYKDGSLERLLLDSMTLVCTTPDRKATGRTTMDRVTIS